MQYFFARSVFVRENVVAIKSPLLCVLEFFECFLYLCERK